jgi:hypothetical protein
MTGPVTTNPTATKVNAAIDAAVKGAETLVDNLVIADLSAWAGPLSPVVGFICNAFVKPLVSPLVSYIGSKFSIGLQIVGTFTVIDVQVGQETAGISKALADLIAAEKTGDPNAIKTALAAYQVAASALANDDGSATPSS